MVGCGLDMLPGACSLSHWGWPLSVSAIMPPGCGWAGYQSLGRGGEEEEPDLSEGTHPGLSLTGVVGQVMELTWSASPATAGTGPLHLELEDAL